MREYDKCNFCKWYDIYEGCEQPCSNKDCFEANTNKIIAKANEDGITVADVIALINLEG